MSRARTLTLTAIAMAAFAANSILCRAALARSGVDPASFTIVRIVSGAAALALIALALRRGQAPRGSWRGAFALFAYAAAFSFAYVSLPAGVGALLLFGAVQATMILVGIAWGERPTRVQALGLLVALGGVAALVAPGVSAPPLISSALMLGAGVAWGAYSILGRTGGDPLLATAGNFLRAVPMTLVLAPLAIAAGPPGGGLVYAVLSGAVASGVGYSIWYAALPGLSAAEGASVQLSVPVIAAVAGATFLAEPMTMRLALSSVAVLGGIAVVIFGKVRRSG